MQRQPKQSRATLAAERDARLQRASMLTRWTVGGAIVLVGAFAGLFAHAKPGHHLGQTTPAQAAAPTPAGVDDSPVAPAVAPDPTAVPPVVQSGGS